MFTPKDKATACGMWSTTYIIALSVVICLIVVGLILSRKMSHKGVKITIIIMAVFATLTEVIKMIFVGVTYGIKEVEFTPLYFCSLFIYATIIVSTSEGFLQNIGLSFLFFGGIIGATAFFIYPNACIPNYPIYHFMCLRTMSYHAAMIYTGVLIVMTGFYRPQVKHFWNYLIGLSIVCVFAYSLNLTTGSDFMYISKPLDFKLSQIVFDSVPTLYPFIIIILQILVPFWTSFALYRLAGIVKKQILRKKEKNHVHN